MVDLGFYLLLFFYFYYQKYIRLWQCNLTFLDDNGNIKAKLSWDEKTITFILGNNVFYYAGFLRENFTKIQFDQLRQIVMGKKSCMMNKFTEMI